MTHETASTSPYKSAPDGPLPAFALRLFTALTDVEFGIVLALTATVIFAVDRLAGVAL